MNATSALSSAPARPAAARKSGPAKAAKPAVAVPPPAGKAQRIERPAVPAAAPKAGAGAKAVPKADGPAIGSNPPRPGSKRAQVVALIARPNGASADEIKAAFKADEWTDRHVRECVAILRRAHGVPVVAREDGRFVIGKPGEATVAAKAAKPGAKAEAPAAAQPAKTADAKA